MNGIMKVLTGILAVLAVTASLATAGIIGYSMIHPQESRNVEVEEKGGEPASVEVSTLSEQTPTAAPAETPSQDAAVTPTPLSPAAVSPDHVHDYEESVDKRATCYSAGKIKYACRECGDIYYVDVMSTGHVADEWEVVRKPTEDQEGLRVKKCIYCDEVVAQESVPYKDKEDSDKEEEDHIHQYSASTEREPSCILAGLRMYSCSCGNFYTESIPALGHVATDWEVAAEPTTTKMGTEQRTCSVCGVLLDSRPVNKLTPSPSASPSAEATATAAQNSASPGASGGTPAPASTPTATPSATPTATPHTHEYQSYVLRQPTCTQIGIRSFVCTCGSSYAEEIERDLNSHSYRAVVIPATSATQGYTVYTCVRCNYSYFDNYTPTLKK